MLTVNERAMACHLVHATMGYLRVAAGFVLLFVALQPNVHMLSRNVACQAFEREYDVNLEFAPSRNKSQNMTVTG